MNTDFLNTADTHPLLGGNPNCCRTPELLKMALSYSTVIGTFTDVSCILCIVQAHFGLNSLQRYRSYSATGVNFCCKNFKKKVKIVLTVSSRYHHEAVTLHVIKF